VRSVSSALFAAAALAACSSDSENPTNSANGGASTGGLPSPAGSGGAPRGSGGSTDTGGARTGGTTGSAGGGGAGGTEGGAAAGGTDASVGGGDSGARGGASGAGGAPSTGGADAGASGGSDGSTGGTAPSTGGTSGAGGTSGSGGTGGVSPVSPSSLAGLALWLEGDVGVATNSLNYVTGWADQSGHHNDAVESSGGGSVFSSGPNGHAIVAGVFSIADSASLDFGSSDFMVEEVLLPSWGGFSYAQGGLFLSPGRTSQKLTVPPSVTVSASVDLGTAPPHVVGIWRHGTALELRIDGVASSGTLGARTFGGNIWLGDSDGLRTSGNVFQGTFAEVVVASGTVTGSAVAGVELYLKNRFGI